jgi:hypothetical protein
MTKDVLSSDVADPRKLEDEGKKEVSAITLANSSAPTAMRISPKSDNNTNYPRQTDRLTAIQCEAYALFVQDCFRI